MAQDRYVDIRLIVIPASDIRLLGEPHTTPTAEDLKQAIDTLLTDPLEKIPEDFNSKQKALDMVAMATKLSSHSPEITAAYRKLTTQLPKDQIDLSTIPRQLAALTIAQVLTWQLQLPHRDRFIFRKTGLSAREARELRKILLQSENLQEQIPPSPESQEALDQLSQKIINFYQLFAQTLTEDQSTPEAILRQLRIISRLNDLANSPLYDFCKPALPERVRDWPTAASLKHWRQIQNHSLAANLLLSDELTEVNTRVKWLVLAAPFQKIITGNDLTSPPFTTLAQYFLDHKELQLEFWNTTYLGWMKIDQGGQQQLHNRYLDAVPNYYSITEWFFAQEETVVSQFLDTIPIEQLDRKKLLSLLRKLLGTQAMCRQHFPDRDWQTSLNHLERLAEKTNLISPISQELAITKKRRGGVIYLNQQLEAQARIPKPGESEEDVVTKVLLEHNMPVLLIVRETGQPPSHEQTTETLPYWGQVIVLDENESLEVASQLDRLLQNPRANTPRYENLLPSNRNEPQVILPKILPIDNPLHHLANIGIVSISHDSGRITLIIDRERTRVAATFPTNSLPENSTLRRLCKAAQDMLTAHLDPKELTRDELRTIHSSLRIWNSTAKAKSLPQLTVEESTGSIPVLTVVGTKAVRLYLAPLK